MGDFAPVGQVRLCIDANDVTRIGDEFQVIADPEGNELCICTISTPRA